MKNILVVILCTCCFFVSSEIRAQKISWLEGTWSGEGDQPDALTQTKWKVNFSYEPATGILKVDYPSLGCGGEWTLVSSDNASATFTENLSYGFDKCMNGCKVIIYHLDNNYRRMYYYDPENPYLQVAVALVEKQ